jgi:hypothetical protein
MTITNFSWQALEYFLRQLVHVGKRLRRLTVDTSTFDDMEPVDPEIPAYKCLASLLPRVATVVTLIPRHFEGEILWLQEYPLMTNGRVRLEMLALISNPPPPEHR